LFEFVDSGDAEIQALETRHGMKPNAAVITSACSSVPGFRTSTVKACIPNTSRVQYDTQREQGEDMTYLPTEKLQLKFDDVVWREVDDQVIVLELETSTYLTLNGTAKPLWEALAGGITFGALVELLTDSYQVTPEQATCDTENFLTNLTSRNLLQRQP
jgi:hypothetical protein